MKLTDFPMQIEVISQFLCRTTVNSHIYIAWVLHLLSVCIYTLSYKESSPMAITLSIKTIKHLNADRYSIDSSNQKCVRSGQQKTRNVFEVHSRLKASLPTDNLITKKIGYSVDVSRKVETKYQFDQINISLFSSGFSFWLYFL